MPDTVIGFRNTTVEKVLITTLKIYSVCVFVCVRARAVLGVGKEYSATQTGSPYGEALFAIWTRMALNSAWGSGGRAGWGWCHCMLSERYIIYDFK